MDNQDFIERHAWFGAMHNMQNVNYDNQLMGWDGRPNDLGWRYGTSAALILTSVPSS
jgi:hypothetical protein